MGKVLLEEQSLIDIANSIRNKTGSNETMKPSEMATNIDGIESGGTDLSEYFTETVASSVGGDSFLYSIIKLPAFRNTGTTCANMFKNYKGYELDLSNFNTSNVTEMSDMFYNCSRLKNLDVSNFNTEKVTKTDDMFRGCNQLTSLDLSNFNTSNVTNMSYMFNGCIRLTNLDIRNFDFSNVTKYTDMFGQNTNTGVPDNCLIIVKDEMAKSWLNTNFSRMTNVKTVTEYESGV